jgi:predicted nucleic acid-binding protein
MEEAKEVMESYCSSDDEVCFGPITLKEIKKALTMRRQTQVLNRTSE